ncbi:MAG: acyl-CoA thioesterase [Mycobacterium sp.]|jgi:acyl-CoA hydrolase|uniref:acyl-CoA thioesterase n=1 Tax=Mycobacterium sp. TaxID=1785 RepID=UPI003899D46E
MNTLAEHTERFPLNAHCHETIHRVRVTARDVSIAGFVDGGTLLEWIDTAAYATVAQWCGGHCVAASIGNIHLDRPISVGELVELHASLVYTGHSSMHILVTICSSDPARAKAVQTAQCSIVFVAVDAGGNPVEVHRWTPLTMLELQRHRQARARVRTRRRIEDAVEAQSYTGEGTAPQITLRFRAASADTNSDGNVRGGRVMRWIDEAAYACGADWTGAEVITSYIAGIRFYQTIFVGDVIEVTARTIHTGPRSIHTTIRVTTTDTVGGQPCLVAHAVVVVVSLGEHGEAQPVPQWAPASDEDHRLDHHARHLIELRQHIEPFTTHRSQ